DREELSLLAAKNQRMGILWAVEPLPVPAELLKQPVERMAGGQSGAPPAPDHPFDLHGRKRIVELHYFGSIGAGFQLGQARLQISAHRVILSKCHRVQEGCPAAAMGLFPDRRPAM